MKFNKQDIGKILECYKPEFRFIEEAELVEENTLVAKIKINNTFYGQGINSDIGYFAWAELPLPTNQLGYLLFEAKHRSGSLQGLTLEEQEKLRQEPKRFIAVKGKFNFKRFSETKDLIPVKVTLRRFKRFKDGAFCILDYDYNNGAASLELKAKLALA